MRRWLSQILWVSGMPLRLTLVLLIRMYRATLGPAVSGRCRFYPSCSAYAETAIGRLGVVRGVALSSWRVLRCSPLSKGGVDQPPLGRGAMPDGTAARVYDATIQGNDSGVPWVSGCWSR